MNVAGIDTATPATVAGVLRADGVVFEASEHPAPGERPAHAARTLALLEQCLAAAELTWDDVGRLAVGVGPGGFTGLRIGIASARALAQARGIELVPVSSLRALAHGGAAAIDARRGEVFGALWEDGEVVVPAGAYAPEAFAGRVAGLPVLGDGALAHRAVFEAAGCTVAPDGDPGHRIAAGDICRLGAQGSPVPLAEVVPDYRREPDAVPPSNR